VSGHLLILDPIATNRIVQKVKLASAFYSTAQAATVADALTEATKRLPDAILTVPVLPDGDLGVLKDRLTRVIGRRDIPIIAFTGRPDAATRAAILRAGADTVITKPVTDDELLARVRSILRRRQGFGSMDLDDSEDGLRFAPGMGEGAAAFLPAEPVAIVSESSHRRLLWKTALSALGRRDLICLDPVDALAAQSDLIPDAYVIEADRIGGPGLRLISELRSRSETAHATTLIVAKQDSTGLVPTALDLGAGDACSHGFDADEVHLRLGLLLRAKRAQDRRRRKVEDRLEAAMLDPLTGLHNRRYAHPHLANLARDARQHGTPLSILALDLDHFKAVNDMHGHAVGDAVLVEFAARLRAHLRAGDLCARVGGEEFLVALPQTNAERAQQLARRLCGAISSTPFRISGLPTLLSISVSVGLTVLDGTDHTTDAPDNPDDLTALLAEADRALYAAKARGRNCVSWATRAA